MGVEGLGSGGWILIAVVAVVLIIVRLRRNRTQNSEASSSGTGPMVQEGIDEETVAAISAALACILGEEGGMSGYRIASIQRSKQMRPVWALAGMQQNTKSF